MKLNQHTVLFTLVLVCLCISGCSSTDNTPVNKEVANYASRCDTQSSENTSEFTPPVPRYMKPPMYPASAARSGVEGYVILEFDISAQGTPVNIGVLESYPAAVFDDEAIRSFKGWRYEPVASTCHSVRLDFNLGQRKTIGNTSS